MVLEAVKDVVKNTLQLMKDDLLDRIPVETGELRKSVDYKIDADGLGGTLLIDNEYAVNICRPYW